MPTAAPQLNEVAAEWRAARRVYSVYCALAKQHKLGPLCPELDDPADRNDPAALARARKWLADMDGKIEAFQLRSLLQVTQLGSDETLRALCLRVLTHEPKDDRDRDKLDFLMVQYFSQCSPPGYHKHDVELNEVEAVLEPILGECSTQLPDWMAPLEGLLKELHDCSGLADLLERRILDRGRQLKAEAGEMYFGSAALLGFTRFNFHVRRTFFRLMHADVHAIRQGLHNLEAAGIHTLDCSMAGLKAEEPIAELRKICHDWKTPFRAAYSMGQNFLQMVKVRAAVEAAVTGIAEMPKPAAKHAKPAHAAPAPPAPARPPAAPAPPAPPKPSAKPPAPPPAAAAAPAPPAAPARPTAAADRRPAELVQKPAAVKSQGETPAEVQAFDLQPVLERIAEELISASDKKGVSITAIHIGETKLLLSSWEAAAFVQGGDDASDALQRAVAARAVLFDVVDRCKKAGGPVEPGSDPARSLASALLTAKMESVTISDKVLAAKQAQNIDAAVNLAASGKRLLTVIEEAKKLEPA